MTETDANAQAMELAALAWQESERWEELYRKATALLAPFAESPHATVQTLTTYGALLSDAGRHSEALRVLRTAERKGTPLRMTLYNLAVALMNTPSRSKAKAYFDRAASISPDDVVCLRSYFDPHGH